MQDITLDEWTPSATREVVRRIFGRKAKLEKRGSEWEIYVPAPHKLRGSYILGVGKSPFEAFEQAVLIPVKMKEERDKLMAEVDAQAAGAPPGEAIEGGGLGEPTPGPSDAS